MDPAALFNSGRFLLAHEAWEDLWRVEREPLRRRRLQGLAQLAAALIKASEGTRGGAAKLFGRARENLAAAGSGTDPWDVERLVAELGAWLDSPASARVHLRAAG